jgi:hypothetical protein
MNTELVSAEYLEDHKLSVVFADGKMTVVDLSQYAARGGVFEKFKDLDYFKNFSINPDFGVLTWQGGVDIAPETLYSLATGEPLPSWMNQEETLSETPNTLSN